jgi:hypothetical protein
MGAQRFAGRVVVVVVAATPACRGVVVATMGASEVAVVVGGVGFFFAVAGGTGVVATLGL